MTAEVRALPMQASPQITTEIVRITPAIAEKMLGKNVHNRHVRSRVVEKYRRAIVAGEWVITGESIKFGANGDLLDGQHRLTAIIESGKTVSMIVVKGLPSSAQDVMDTGIARTAGDQLGIAGFSDPNALAAAGRAVILYETGQLSSKLGPSTPQIRETGRRQHTPSPRRVPGTNHRPRMRPPPRCRCTDLLRTDEGR